MTLPPPADLAETQPSRTAAPLDAFQPIRLPRTTQTAPSPLPRKRPFVLLLFLLPLLVYFFAPLPTRVLILGVDGGLQRGDLGRTDTIVLGSISPLRPRINLLSIPRDLWVPIPGVGENRINTAYFFAEAEQPGSGPAAVAATVRENFGVATAYYIVLRMDGVIGIVDAVGGVDVVLEQPISGYAAGEYHFSGPEALAFARSRAGSDDFARLRQGQLIVKALFGRMLQAQAWLRLPQLLLAVNAAVDTNLPPWQWPRLGLALLRAGPAGLDTRAITRDMVTPFVTEQGAQVLAPNWELIQPLVEELFR